MKGVSFEMPFFDATINLEGFCCMFQCSDLRALLNLCRPYRASQSPVGTTAIWQAVKHSVTPAIKDFAEGD